MLYQKIHQIEVEESTSLKKKKIVKDREVGGKSTNALQLSSNKHPQEQNISVCLRRNEGVSVDVG